MKKDPYRKERVANVLMHSLTRVLHQKSSYFKFRDITISFIRMSNDLRIANVYCRCLTNTEQSAEVNEVANEAANANEEALIKDLNEKQAFIRHNMASFLYLKFLPELKFHYDHIPEEEHHFRHILDSIHSN